MQTPESCLTQEEVARMLGITKSAVYQYERNAFRKIRRAFEVEAAARGVTVQEIVRDLVEH